MKQTLMGTVLGAARRAGKMVRENILTMRIESEIEGGEDWS